MGKGTCPPYPGRPQWVLGSTEIQRVLGVVWGGSGMGGWCKQTPQLTCVISSMFNVLYCLEIRLSAEDCVYVSALTSGNLSPRPHCGSTPTYSTGNLSPRLHCGSAPILRWGTKSLDRLCPPYLQTLATTTTSSDTYYYCCYCYYTLLLCT